ncbi:TolB family protein [Nonomuraea cavernae]|uniref:TolB family protein n=1 Tax=Nonomuraea cavernae TaxID=2045107 RepID=UPI0033DF5147
MMHKTLAGVTLGATVLLAAAPAAAAVPAARAATDRDTVAARTISGAAVYAGYQRGYTVSRSRPGAGLSALAKPGDSPQFAASPDGRKVAWITAGGLLRVREGAKVTTAARGLQGGTPCLSPVWSPDSRRVAYVHVGRNPAGWVSVVNADGTGERMLGSTRGVCHLAWSPDGRYLAGYAGTTAGVYRLDVKTGKAAKVKGVALANHVQSLSPGGRYVVVRTLRANDDAGDGSWPQWFTPTLVDTVSGRKVPIGVKGRQIGAFHLADGRLVVRVAGSGGNTLVVLDERGRVVQRLSEPVAARNQALLQVIR